MSIDSNRTFIKLSNNSAILRRKIDLADGDWRRGALYVNVRSFVYQEEGYI